MPPRPENSVSESEAIALCEAEIFLNQRDKLRLEVEIQFRTNKINRIRKGYAENDGPPATGGFLF